MTYLLIKSLHIFAVISRMAGLLYLYRLYVNHRRETEPIVQERFRGMALAGHHGSRCLRGRFFGSGDDLAHGLRLRRGRLATAKLVLVAALLAAHFLAGYYRLRFAELPRIR